jgi:hypothetical protein
MSYADCRVAIEEKCIVRRRRLILNGMASIAIACMLSAIPLYGDPADFQIFNDKASYTGVVLQQGRVQTDADWNEETAGAIQQGEVFGIFSYDFDPAVVLPVVGSGIVSGLAVGAEPDGAFHGDQGISLVVKPGLALDTFGREIVYGPFEGEATSDIFRLIVECPNEPCVFIGNPTDLDPHGGSLFLGVVAPPGVPFRRVTLDAVTPRDNSGEPIGVVPDWQVAAITFSAVPEPSTVALVALGFCCLTPKLRASLRRSGRQ